MQSKKLTKTGAGFIAIFAILLMTTGLMMTACQSTVNPSSPGVATSTKTFTPTPIITSTPTATGTPNLALTPLPAGSIQFIGWVRNGAGQFGFISPSATLPTGTVIYFTDLSWDSTLNSGAGGWSDQSVSISSKNVEVETMISCTLTSPLSPNTPIFIGNPSDVTNGSGYTLANVVFFNNATASPNGSNLTGGITTGAAVTQIFMKQSGQGNGDKLFAFTCPAASVPSLSNSYLPTGTVFTTAMIYAPTTWTSSAITSYNTSGLPSGLTNGTTALDLHQLWQDALTNFSTPMATAVAGGGNENAFLNGATCPSGSPATNSNWVGAVVGAGSFSLSNAITAANQGNVPCTGGYGFAATPTVVMPY